MVCLREIDWGRSNRIGRNVGGDLLPCLPSREQSIFSTRGPSRQVQYPMIQTSTRRLVTALAWIAIIAIAYATLMKAEFVYAIYFKLTPYLMRPEVQTYTLLERIVTFASLGALFSVAYPQRTFLVCFVVFGATIFLEVAQTLTPDRHGTLMDALVKIAGGAAGILLVRAIQFFRVGRHGTADLSPLLRSHP